MHNANFSMYGYVHLRAAPPTTELLKSVRHNADLTSLRDILELGEVIYLALSKLAGARRVT